MRFCAVLTEPEETPVSDDVKTAVQSWGAETQMRAVQDYVSRGRRLEHTPEAEYSLRGLKPPTEPARNEMDILLNAAHQSDRRGYQQ
jgi:hypothetical protein